MLYDVLGATNPFAECAAPKFAPEKIELRYHTASQLGQLLRELREDRGSYFGHLTYHLAAALFFTGCRFHEWARLTIDRLIREPGGMIIAARLQVKGSSFRDLTSPRNCRTRSRNGSLSWKVSRACGFGAGESTSRDLRSFSLAGTAPHFESVKKSGVADQCRLGGCLLRFLSND
jgi:integrase